jgi:hypothetical protein
MKVLTATIKLTENSNGSYYYSNPNGSTYHNDGKGGSTYSRNG